MHLARQPERGSSRSSAAPCRVGRPEHVVRAPPRCRAGVRALRYPLQHSSDGAPPLWLCALSLLSGLCTLSQVVARGGRLHSPGSNGTRLVRLRYVSRNSRRKQRIVRGCPARASFYSRCIRTAHAIAGSAKGAMAFPNAFAAISTSAEPRGRLVGCGRGERLDTECSHTASDRACIRASVVRAARAWRARQTECMGPPHAASSIPRSPWRADGAAPCPDAGARRRHAN
jgi:hypothetical protein